MQDFRLADLRYVMRNTMVVGRTSLEDGTDGFSRNVGDQLPTYAA